MTPEHIERVARALFEQAEERAIKASAELSADPSMWLTWETGNEPMREPYRDQARAAIEALEPFRLAAIERAVAEERERAIQAVAGAVLPKQRWSCSDDESGTSLTLGRQRQFSIDAIRSGDSLHGEGAAR